MPDLDYDIVEAPTREGLVSGVRSALKDGWGLLGSAFIKPSKFHGGRESWCQTLYKDSDLVAGKEPRIQIIGFNKNSKE